MRDEIQTRIEKLKKDIEEASGEKPVFGTAPTVRPSLKRNSCVRFSVVNSRRRNAVTGGDEE